MPPPHHCCKLALWAVSCCEAATHISPWALPVPSFSKWQVVIPFCQNSAHKSALHSMGVTMLEGPATTLSWHHRQGWQASEEDLSWDRMTVPTVFWGHLWRKIFKWYICSAHTEVLGVGSGILGVCSSRRGLGCSYLPASLCCALRIQQLRPVLVQALLHCVHCWCFLSWLKRQTCHNHLVMAQYVQSISK